MEQSIEVNGVEIPQRAIELEAQNHPAENAQDAFGQAAEALVIRELLKGRALELGLAASSDSKGDETAEEALIEALLEQEIKLPRADEAACRRYFEANPEHFVTPTQYEPSHILFSAPADDGDRFKAATLKAEETIKALLKTPGDFARLAHELSDCPSAKEGGSLGQVELGQTVPEFETFMINLEPGQLCPVPVKTHYGVHIIMLDNKMEGRKISFEDASRQIADYLHEASWRQAVSQYVRLLVGQAKIKGFSMDGAASPLVQ